MKHTAGILTVALAVGSSAALAQSPGHSEHRSVDAQLLSKYRDANTRLEKARGLFEKKDLAGTRNLAEDCLKSVPELADAHFLLSKVAYLEKDYPKALSAIESAKTDHVKTVEFREQMNEFRLSDLRKRLREKNEFVSNLRSQQGSGGSTAEAQAQLRNAEAEKAELERILAEPTAWDSAIPAEYDYVHGNIQLKLKSYDAAVAQYLEALRKNPRYSEAANNLASVYFSAKRYAQAQEVVTKAESAGAVLNPELKKAIEEGLAKPK